MARIAGFYPEVPGSIPGVGGHLLVFVQKLTFSETVQGNNFRDIIYYWCFFLKHKMHQKADFITCFIDIFYCKGSISFGSFFII